MTVRPLKVSLLSCPRNGSPIPLRDGKKSALINRTLLCLSRRGSAVFLTRALVWGFARNPFPSVDRY